MSTLRRFLSGVIIALTLTTLAVAAPPTGNWAINANGHNGVMVLNVINGTVTGTLLGNPVKGFWTESSQRLVLYRAINGTTLSTPPEFIQIYEGYQFPALSSNPTGPQRLAGEFQAFAGTGASATRSVFGWYATK
jgi:hypothetical protein